MKNDSIKELSGSPPDTIECRDRVTRHRISFEDFDNETATFKEMFHQGIGIDLASGPDISEEVDIHTSPSLLGLEENRRDFTDAIIEGLSAGLEEEKI